MNEVETVFQVESYECGLACLVMIQRGLGGDISLNEFRERVGGRDHELSIKDIIHCAKKMHLTGRPVQCDLDELRQLALPAILHWRFNHWVVLTKITGNQFTVHDPVEGRLPLPRSVISQLYTGIAIEFSKLTTIENRSNKKYIKINNILSKSNLNPMTIGLLFLTMGLFYLLVLTLPLFLKLVVDDVLVRKDHNLLFTLAAGFTILGLTAQFLYWLQGKLALYLALQLQVDLSTSILERLLRLPPHYFRTRTAPALLSRLASIRPVQQFISQGLIQMAINTIMLCLCLITISNLVPAAGIILAAFITALFCIYYLAIPRLKKTGESALIKETSFQSEANDVFQNISSIQRYQAETFSKLRLQEKQMQALVAENNSAGIQLALTTAQNLLLHLSHVMLIFILSSQVMAGSISLGTCYLILSYRHFLTEATKGLGCELLGILAMRLHLDRISDFYVYQPSEPATHVSSIESGSLILQNLSIVRKDRRLHYPFKIQINPGQLLIIQGPSGCGKSTLVEAIAGSIPIAAGTLSWGSKPAGTTLHQWSPQQVGSVLGGDRLHLGTIASNIRMHQPGGDPDQLRTAACTTLLHQDIMALPLAYDTLISASNVPLSLGQIQKLLIARAIYHKPKLLLLDESTANLDPLAEEQLLSNLRQAGMTLVIATHRDNLTLQADVLLINTSTGWQIKQQSDG